MHSGQDTNIAGATLRGNDVVGRVGRDLNVTSLPDTGKAQGKEFDLSATVVVGFGGSVSGSVGYGQTNGSKNWIEEQTRITAKDKVDIRTENHTQLDGALIASDSGNLKLDTNTLGYSDIAGKDKEHGYYLNVGGSYGTGSSTTQDPSQVGKGGNQKNGWSVEGWNYNKDREQIVRGTVGAGDVVVRSDTGGKDSTAGLNRDVDKAYEITRDDEHRTDVYVTKSSLEAVASPKETLEQWQKSAALYGENSRNTIDKLADMLAVTALLPLGAVTGNGTDLAQSRVAFAEMMRQLNSLDEDKRSAGVRAVLSGVAKKDLGSNAEALVTRITELGADHPDQALRAMALLTTLNKPTGTSASNFVPVVALGAGALIALSAALSTTAATPEGQDRLREAANAVALSVAQSGQSAEQQVSTSIEIWKFLFSTTFPVHLLDGENSRLVNPIVQAQGANPSSGGYADGATPAGIGSTGGSQIAGQTPVDYSRPVAELPAPGVMNQGVEDGAKGAVAAGSDVEKVVTVSKSRFPESAQHIEDAIDAGKPDILTIDRASTVSNRRDSLRGIETKPGLDRDEYPPAMFQEGGQGASVRHINPSDNRGAGACIGAQCRVLPNGAKVRIDVVD
ncbi:Adhesin/hemagglutinin, HecA protein [Pseudomonas syringae pv. helianthi]|uniref:Adhesin/hemagglutinin, HecA protein n=2 Tax=Pseudomonas syringae pv. helianthi TaxID=251654 RepID=A0A3M6CEY1_9PSED|nr:NucA/NucB deoxyribonuclease domain-containing protein [Pseudomonas syringae group genomosp. 7]RMV42213.1 Adhesin/hemagglutinin, HecA protein [Pseudomonas syringae pv. helianthi]